MATIDYLPVATGTLAEVDPQANFAGSSYQENGFTAGIAEPAEANKVWRQSSMFTAGLANFISQQLGNIDVLDDGDLTALITLITEAIQAAAGSAGAPRAVVIPFSATPVFDLATANAVHAVFEIFLTGNVTSSTFAHLTPGTLITLVIAQTGGPFSFAFPTAARGAGTVAPVINSVSIQQFVVMASSIVRAVGGVTVTL